MDLNSKFFTYSNSGKSMSKIQLITGATGFVGSSIVLELLSKTQDEIFCITRSHKNFSTVQDYLVYKLVYAAKSYCCEELIDQIHLRCKAIESDICYPMVDSVMHHLPRADEFWHCAASLEYQEIYKEEITRQNYHGTLNALELAHSLKINTFNYISTAYVAGSTTGFISEDLCLPDSNKYNNCYEQSKIAAESEVAKIKHSMSYRIFRPSIVIGHSQTFAALPAWSARQHRGQWHWSDGN